MNDDPNRVDPPDDMPEPRFSKHPDTLKSIKEVYWRCIEGSAADFETLFGDSLAGAFQIQLRGLPLVGLMNEETTLRDAQRCVDFVKTMHCRLRNAVDSMDLGEINDFFSGEEL